MDQEYKDWAVTLPEPARSLAFKYPPGRYRNKTVNGLQVMVPLAYSDDGTIRVLVLTDESDMVAMPFDYEVFGVIPTDLEPIEGSSNDSQTQDHT